MAFCLITPKIQLKRNEMQIGAEGIEHLFLTSSFVTMVLQKKAALKKADSKDIFLFRMLVIKQAML
jgi:hypothetical protein